MVEDAVEKKPLVKPRVVDVELYPVLTVNGKVKDEIASGLVPEHVVPPEHEAEMTPELVSVPPELERPVPNKLLNELPFTMRLVVEAVANDA
jgi:hypothetical protein